VSGCNNAWPVVTTEGPDVNCTEIGPLLHGYADGELDLVRSLEVEQHLQECSACAAALGRQQALGRALREEALYHRAPPRLARRVRSALRQEHRPRAALRPLGLPPLVAAASLALAALLAWVVVRVLPVSSAEDQVIHEVVSAHVRSLLADHLFDVASTDEHTVKPWFKGRVDFSPPVKQLAAEGYPLKGGRLDYLDNRNVAALVYQRRRHVINLFIWPAAGAADTGPRALTRQGYHLFRWTSGGLTYWAVSDLNEDELREFVRLVQG
jgi:anti-sigma factor RsiW